MRNRVFGSLLVSIVACACNDASAPAGRDPAMLGIDGPGAQLVRARTNAAFVEHRRFLTLGTRLDGHCVFSSTDTLTPGEHYVDRIVAYDVNTCDFITGRGDWASPREHWPAGDFQSKNTQILGRGHPAASSISLDAIGRRSWYAAATGTKPLWDWGDVSLGTAPPTYSAYASQYLYFEDPLQIDVTSSRLGVAWDYNTICVENSLSNHNIQWFYPTGWTLAGDSHSATPGCNSWPAYASAVFVNTPFCDQYAQTWTHITVNNIWPHADGNAVMDDSAYADGDCSALLTYYRERTYP